MTIQLRDYQTATIDAVHAGLRRSKRVLCVAPTGSGKRVVAVWWTLRGSEAGRKLLVVTDRRILVEQMADECRARGVSYGIVMGDSPRNDEALVQIASIQTLKTRKWLDMPAANLIIVDECFPAGTMIDGKPIEQIRVGDSVRSFNHSTGTIELRKVTKTFRRDVDKLAAIRFNDASQLTCTIGHPVFVRSHGTSGRYVAAGCLVEGSEVIADARSSVFSMRKDVHRSQTQAVMPSSMFAGVQVCADVEDSFGNKPEICVGANEDKQPDAQGGHSREDGESTSGDTPQASLARRKRPWIDEARTVVVGHDRLEACNCSMRKGMQKGRTSAALQNRPRESSPESGHRNRWSFSRLNRTQAAGSEETGVLRVAGVDCYSLQERSGGRGCVGVRGTCRVYNLEVEGNNNYFANGILVHNCHQASQAYDELFQRHPGAKAIGLTATPVGAQGRSLIGLFDEIVEPVKNTRLIQEGWLLPTHVIAPSEPDISGVTVNDGKEFNQEELGKKVESCTVFADIFEHWEQYSDMQTLCFVPRVKFAYGLAKQFQERGFAAEVIEGGTSKRDRHALFDDYRNLQKRVLISVDVLREGLDLPVAQVGIDLQPNSQFRTWWQKLGRVRRPHGDQQKAFWLDFAGNVYRHVLHPDEDPPWSEITSLLSTQDVIDRKAGRVCPACGGKDIYKGRCQDCGQIVTPQKAPWCCPNCSYTLSPWERLVDGCCPNCKSKVGKPVRRIRMGDGKMKTVDASVVSTVKKERASREQAMWDKWRYIAHNAGKTLDFARFMYKREMGTFPPAGLKCCPDDPDSGDWKRRPADVYPWMQRR